MISKAYDRNSNPPPGADCSPLIAAHVIPFSLGSFSDGVSHLKVSAIRVNIYRYFPSLRSRLDFMVEDINSVQNNIITLLPPLRVEFGEFRFALEATNYIPNQYRIKVFRSFSSY
jgi:HNH endonuclease